MLRDKVGIYRFIYSSSPERISGLLLFIREAFARRFL
jgi:hypothetical protein